MANKKIIKITEAQYKEYVKSLNEDNDSNITVGAGDNESLVNTNGPELKQKFSDIMSKPGVKNFVNQTDASVEVAKIKPTSGAPNGGKVEINPSESKLYTKSQLKEAMYKNYKKNSKVYKIKDFIK